MSSARILFVDDEANVIEGLKRSLRSRRREWETVFVGSPIEALQRLAEQPCDLIVTDLHLAPMSGAELLEQVASAYPNMARMVLSGYSDEKLTTQAAHLAHRFLSKPVAADDLIRAIADTLAGQEDIVNPAILSRLTTCATLPSPPMLYGQIVSLTQSESANAHQVAAVVARDISLTAKLLQLVNSSFFGIGRRVSSVEQAIALLGLIRIKALVLAEEIVKSFQLPGEDENLDINCLWTHACAVADLARAISAEEGQTGDRPDQAFTAGLLHDVGSLVLATYCWEDFRVVTRLAHTEECPIWEVEDKVFGASHARIGAALLNLWGLPTRIIEAVACHHDPDRLTWSGMCAVTAVHVADVLLSARNGGDGMIRSQSSMPTLHLGYLERVGLLPRIDRWRILAEQRHGAELCSTKASQ